VAIVVGPMFDLGYFRSLLAVGTVLITIGMFLVGITEQFYQVLLTQGVLMGLGMGCLFLPAPAVVAQYFDASLGLAVSIASVGSAVGTLIFSCHYWLAYLQMSSNVGHRWHDLSSNVYAARLTHRLWMGNPRHCLCFSDHFNSSNVDANEDKAYHIKKPV